MSAVAGLVRFDGRLPGRAAAAQMLAPMRHRGRDTEGAWTNGPAALGQATTFTTTESWGEHGPVVVGPFALAADARVDNRDELIPALGSDLRALGLLHAHRPPTDPEVLLAAFARWGRGLLERVVGDYAFAAWDRRTRALLLARDPFGTRPLFYLHRPGVYIAFASETKALRALAGDRFDPAFLVDRVFDYGGDPERTPVEGVRALLGAHALSVEGDEDVRIQAHYEVRPDPNPGPMTDTAVAARFGDLFEQAVQCRVRSAYPVGADLSGGLDSSSVVAVARTVLARDNRGPLHTFSTVHDFTPELDERVYIEAVVAQGGVTPHLLLGNDLSALAALGESVPIVDDDFLLGAQFLMWANLTAAADNGVRTVLTGYDGDSVVSHGRARLRELAGASDWRAFATETLALATRYQQATHRQGFEDVLTSPAQMFLHFGLPALDALAEQGPWWRYADSLRGASQHAGARAGAVAGRVWRRLLVPKAILSRRQRAPRGAPDESKAIRARVFSSEFAALPAVRERIERALAEPPFPTFETATEEHLYGLRYLTVGRTAGLFSLMAGARGVEVAHPFLDRRLVEFSAALPSDQKLRDGWTRYVQRRAMAPVLPPSIAWRVGKALFTPAFERVLYDLDRGPTEILLDAAEHGASQGTEYFSVDAVRELARAGVDGEARNDALLATSLTALHWLSTRRAAPPVDADRTDTTGDATT